MVSMAATIIPSLLFRGFRCVVVARKKKATRLRKDCHGLIWLINSMYWLALNVFRVNVHISG